MISAGRGAERAGDGRCAGAGRRKRHAGTARRPLRIETHGLEQLGGIVRRLGAFEPQGGRTGSAPPERERCECRAVEGRIGILEDHLERTARQATRRRSRRPSAPEEDPPVVGVIEARDDVRDRRLAAAGFPDEAEDLALSGRRELTPSTARKVLPATPGSQPPIRSRRCRFSTAEDRCRIPAGAAVPSAVRSRNGWRALAGRLGLVAETGKRASAHVHAAARRRSARAHRRGVGPRSTSATGPLSTTRAPMHDA